MLGAIIGDTVGSHYEFNNTKDYNFEMFARPSSYTDDSVMTMAVAHWLLSDPQQSYQGLEDAMVEFGEKFPCPMGDYGGLFYQWLFAPEGEWRDCGTPYESLTGRRPYGSWGNGSAMRVSAVGWFFGSLEKTLEVARRMKSGNTSRRSSGMTSVRAGSTGTPFTDGSPAARGRFPRPSSPSWIRTALRTPSERLSPWAGIQTRWPASPGESPRPTTRRSRPIWWRGPRSSSPRSSTSFSPPFGRGPLMEN